MKTASQRPEDERKETICELLESRRLCDADLPWLLAHDGWIYVIHQSPVVAIETVTAGAEA